MKAQDVADAKQRGLMISLICILVMLLLYFAVGQVTENNKERWDDAVTELMERDFRVAVASARTQAKLSGRVAQIQMDGRLVSVNSRGNPWVVDALGEPDCGAIWLQVMGLPLEHPSYQLSAIKVRETVANGASSWRCRYLNPNGESFDYLP